MADHILDLTHPLEKSLFTWPGDPSFEQTAWKTDATFRLHRIQISEHGGTHIGTAAHFDPAGQDAAGIPVDELICPGVSVNCVKRCTEDSRYLVHPGDLSDWEIQNGKITPKSVVLIATGWDRFWHQEKRYFGTATQPRFPGISSAAVRWLIEQRLISGLGIDTAGIDGGLGLNLAANRELLQGNRFHLENLTNLTLLPVRDFELFIGALPVVGGTGAPARILARWCI